MFDDGELGYMSKQVSDYRYYDSAPTWANAYLWPVVKQELEVVIEKSGGNRPRALDLGCGNGATAEMIRKMGFDVVGVDPSESGIALAREAYPDCHFEQGSAYDDLASRFGEFDAVVSLEVIEHCYYPRNMLSTTFDLLKRGGGSHCFNAISRLLEEPEPGAYG